MDQPQSTVYSKEQLHEAYSVEHHAHKITQETLKHEQRLNAALRHSHKMQERISVEALTALHVKAPIDFNRLWKSKHIIEWFGGNAFAVIQIFSEGQYVSILYDGGSHKARKKIVKYFKDLNKPIRYATKDAFYKNHQVIIGETSELII